MTTPEDKTLRKWLHHVRDEALKRGYKGLLVAIDHPPATDGGGSVFYSTEAAQGAAAAREGLMRWELDRDLNPPHDWGVAQATPPNQHGTTSMEFERTYATIKDAKVAFKAAKVLTLNPKLSMKGHILFRGDDYYDDIYNPIKVVQMGRLWVTAWVDGIKQQCRPVKGGTFILTLKP